MKKRNLIFASLALWLAGAAQVSADEVENYKFAFDDYASVGFTEADASYGSYRSDNHHDFKPMGWQHVVDKMEGDYSTTYVTYTWSATAGVDQSGALSCGSQSATDPYTYTSKPLYDLLVTPAVSGKVTLDVSAYSAYYGGSLKLYKMTTTDNGYERGDEIECDVEVSYGSYSTATIQLDEPTVIGIRGDYVYIDNFTAEKADIEMIPSLSISVKDLNGDFNDTDAEGNIKLSYDVTVVNNGLVDFAEGYEGYNLTMHCGKDGDVIATLPLTAALAVGEQTVVNFTATLKAADYADGFDAYIKEHISDGSVFASSVKPVAYVPVLTVKDALSGRAADGMLDMGTSREAITCQLVIANEGAAPMNISSISVTDGFTTDATAMTYAAHQSQTVNVTLSADKAGMQQGTLTIKGDDVDYTLNLTGMIAEDGQWFVNFEDCSDSYYDKTKFPAGVVAEANWEINGYTGSSLKLQGNKLCARQNNNTTETKLISPLVEVKAGDVFTFDAAQASTNSVLNVYYSTDRNEWTKVYTVGSEDIAEKDAAFSSVDVNTSTDMYAPVYYAMTKYTVSNIPAGRYYIAVGGKYAYVDNLCGFAPVSVDHDLFVKDATIAETGMVNYASKNVVTLYNANTETEAAGSYTAEFFIGDEKVAEAEAVELAPSATVSFTFNATPHAAGEFDAYAQFTFGDYVVKSQPVKVAIAEESFAAEQQVGTPSGKSTNGILNLEYGVEAMGAALYKAEKIGLAEGTKITSLRLKGITSASSWYPVSSINGKFWIANSELTEMPAIDADFTLEAMIDTVADNCVFDGSIEPVASVGTYSGYSSPYTITESGDIFVINFTKPFVYNGGSIVVGSHLTLDNSYTTFGFEADDDMAGMAVSVQRTSYGSLQKWNQETYRGPINPMTAPVIYFGTEAEAPVYAGKVVGKRNAAIAGAEVVLTAGSVRYTATTDQQGHFAITVMQPALQYELTVSAEGYDTYTADVDMNTVEGEQTIRLTATTTGIESMSNEQGTMRNEVYDLQGRRVNTASGKGIYVISGKKVVVK